MIPASRTALGDVLCLDEDEVAVDPEGLYRIAGMYSFGRGIFERSVIRGSETTYRTLVRLHTNQFVVSRLNGWEGALDVVEPTLDGCHVSNEYPTFTIDDRRTMPRYLYWLCRWPTFWNLLAPRGSMVRRKRVQLSQLLHIDVPMPPIEEQHHLAAKLDAAAARQSKLSNWYARCSVLADAAVVSITSRPDLTEPMRIARGWRKIALADVMRPVIDAVSVDAQTSFPNIGILSFGRGTFEKPPIDGALTSARSLNRVHAMQFIYSRLFAFEGAYAHVPRRFDGYFVSNEFPTFDTDSAQIDARWLASHFRSAERWAELRGASKGLGLRRQRVPVEAVLAYRIWLPPMSQQRRMLRQIDSLDALSARWRRAAEVTGALMPALLNETFSGLS